MNYFKDCTTLDQVKNLLRMLAKELHPDHNGGKDKGFGTMYAQYLEAVKRLKFSSKFQGDKNFDADKFYNLVRKFDGLEDVKISFVGTFVWIEGDTKRQREAIKSISLDGYNVPRWAKKKVAWYYSPLGYQQKARSKYDLEGLKSKYGCKSFDLKGNLKIN